jgi:hypothetical protein
VLESLIFDFLNFKTGRLNPGQAAIARTANISKRSVARGLDAPRVLPDRPFLKRLCNRAPIAARHRRPSLRYSDRNLARFDVKSVVIAGLPRRNFVSIYRDRQLSSI